MKVMPVGAYIMRRVPEDVYASYTHKHCGKCKQVKTVTSFHKNKRNSYRGWGWSSMCMECDRARHRRHVVKNAESRKEKLRQWRDENRAWVRERDRTRRLRSLYNLTREELAAWKAAQEDKCAICDKRDKLCVDHCHKTGKLRGLLCRQCNIMLGWVENRQPLMRRFSSYVRKHSIDTDLFNPK